MAKILYGVTGSIAAYKSAATISKLVQQGDEVQVCLTNSALEFVGKATFEGLTGKPVFLNVFTEGQMMDHIDLTKWADVFVIAPATAETINSFAYGFGSSPLGSLFLAWNFSKPIFIAPAMNSLMLSNPVTQGSIEKLKSIGVSFIDSDFGRLACGDVGYGKMAEPENIILALNRKLNSSPKESILITSGGTEEPIDSVRSITNFSTGTTGVFLANYLSTYFDVTLLKAQRADGMVTGEVHVDNFTDSKSLETKLREHLSTKNYKAVIHAAAVSDFLVHEIYSGTEKVWSPNYKISSDQELSIRFKPAKKIISSIKSFSKNKDLLLIGFKLTTSHDSKGKVDSIFEKGDADIVVHNVLSDARNGQDHVADIHLKNKEVYSFSKKVEIADFLRKQIQERSKEHANVISS